MKTNIGIPQNFMGEIAHELNHLLADEFLLYTKTKNAHWNVEGPDFHSMHVFFESQFEQLDEIIDSIAERVRSLGHFAPATLKGFLELTRLTEQSREQNSSSGFIKELLNDHESIIIRLRAMVPSFIDKWQDAGSSDFVTGLMETHEKMAWMLRAHL
ncbi:Dps family protein [Mucilaginibacter lutimaris]|uniref:Dps family protein n=1 Tax=Mucilaginibacter lutimaris TaxID=931629 RepID=A0ABW2ZEI6_9SPHI